MSLREILGSGDDRNSGAPEVLLFVLLLEPGEAFLGFSHIEHWFAVLVRRADQEVHTDVLQFSSFCCRIQFRSREENGLYRTTGNLGDLETARIAVWQKHLNRFAYCHVLLLPQRSASPAAHRYLPRQRRRASCRLVNAMVYARHGREFMG